MIDSCQFLQCIQKQCWRCTKKFRRLTCNNTSVRKFHGSSRCTCFFFAFQCGRNYLAVFDGHMSLFQKKFNLVNFLLTSCSANQSFHALIISADDLLACSFLACFIINDAVTGHIYAHICRRFVRALAHDLFKHSLKNRENFNVTVVVNSSLTICFQMERVNHVHII